jgi:phosphoribosylaminoimidazolecarboxamide formyltransferase/IMP cyclohydrolase
MIKVKRALISVSDKVGLLDFARGLHQLGIEIISTGGTARLLQAADIPVVEIDQVTGFPEILDGRLKTLHPAVHGALLALRDNPLHMEQLQKYKIGLIDMVVVNLYPFERAIQKKNVSLAEALENIDIGGPTMLRSAAKNFKSVAVVSNPKRYLEVLKELDTNSGLLSDAFLMNLAIEVFQYTSHYDSIIFEFLNNRLKGGDNPAFPKDIVFRFSKVQDLRYGENPHQRAAFYADSQEQRGLPFIKQLNGKELSFNNIVDLNAAVEIIREFTEPAAVVIKHNNPTGVAQDKTLAAAYKQAWACDPLSAFGGIIAVNQKVDLKTAQLISQSGFMECVIAPSYDEAALKLLSEKKNLRVVEFALDHFSNERWDFKQINGGALVQDKDVKNLDLSELKVVTKVKPTKAQMASLIFAWKVTKHVRSNAMVLVKGTKTVGIGCGQTSRVESAMTAIKKAGKNAKGSFLASEAFIPKTDNVMVAAKAGVKIIIQTGGSIADEEVIKAADRARIAMVLTGVRHFKH